jgi:hypothetical protein
MSRRAGFDTRSATDARHDVEKARHSEQARSAVSKDAMPYNEKGRDLRRAPSELRRS